MNFTNIETDTLQVSTTSGDITINSSFIPDISITSSSGYINLKQTEYVDCSLTAKSGEINIANAVSHGNLSLQTGSGDISISYQDKPDSLTFDVASGSEDLSVNFTSADYHIETSARKQGVIGKGEYQLTLLLCRLCRHPVALRFIRDTFITVKQRLDHLQAGFLSRGVNLF